jgi:hypothetical protein
MAMAMPLAIVAIIVAYKSISTRKTVMVTGLGMPVIIVPP